MNKLNLILRAISCASLLLTGGSAIYNSNQLANSQTNIESQAAESQTNPNQTTVDNGHGTVTTEIMPGDSKYQKIEEPSGDSQSSTLPSSNDSTDNTTPEPSTITTPKPYITLPAAPTYKYSNIVEFERAYLGWCPQDVPEGEFWTKISDIVALGYISSGLYAYNDLDSAARYAWDLIRGGFGGQPLKIYAQKLTDVNGYLNLTAFTFIVNTSTRGVTWQQEGAWGDSAKYADQLNSIASQLSTKLIQLDQQFYAKCGY